MSPDTYGLAEASIYVDDLDLNEDWYNDVLDMPTTYTGDGYRFLDPGGRPWEHVNMFDPDHTLEQEFPPAHGAEGDVHLTLRIAYNDLDTWRTRLENHDVNIEGEQEWWPYRHSLFFRDPDGNQIELVTRPSRLQRLHRYMADIPSRISTRLQQ